MRSQRGSALVVAMMVMLVMMLMGLAAMSLGDGQSKSSASERTAESNFNLVDAVMKSQVYLVSQNWPGSSTTAFPSSCSGGSTSGLCPDNTTLTAQFTNTDYIAGISWSTQIYDDAGALASYFSSAGATACGASCPPYDANGDGKVWVRATATIQGRTRVLVAEVQQSLTTMPFPRNVVTAGYFATNNNGKKVIVQSQGAAGQSPGSLAVRCNQPPKSSCLNYPPGKGQISPDTSQTSYSASTALTSAQLSSLRSIAKANNTYYASGCPASLTGSLVFVESGNCSYTGNGVANSPSNPGMFVIANGTLSLGGHYTYYGVIYAANLQGSTGYVVSTSGSSQIIGSVAVDGNGGVLAGASGTNIVFDPNSFSAVQSYAGAGVVQGSWHEISPTQ